MNLIYWLSAFHAVGLLRRISKCLYLVRWLSFPLKSLLYQPINLVPRYTKLAGFMQL